MSCVSCVFIHREGREDVGEEDDTIRLVAPPRLQGNFCGNLWYLGPLSEGWVLRGGRTDGRSHVEEWRGITNSN